MTFIVNSAKITNPFLFKNIFFTHLLNLLNFFKFICYIIVKIISKNGEHFFWRISIPGLRFPFPLSQSFHWLADFSAPAPLPSYISIKTYTIFLVFYIYTSHLPNLEKQYFAKYSDFRSAAQQLEKSYKISRLFSICSNTP